MVKVKDNCLHINYLYSDSTHFIRVTNKKKGVIFMGMMIFESSGTFSPATYGLAVGDVVNVIVVGGGASGVGYISGTGAVAGLAGSASSFGSVATSAGGVATPVTGLATPNGMASGGLGNNLASGGGGGGYLPGVPIYGGTGGSGFYYSGTALTFPIFLSKTTPSGLGGIGVHATNGDNDEWVFEEILALPYANLTRSRVGNKGAGGAENGTGGAGGNGYGAGGGGYYGSGGASGAIAFASHVLTATTGIAVTVGAGGAMTGTTPSRGGAGAKGVVVVFW
jgi:hypothetical protein